MARKNPTPTDAEKPVIEPVILGPRSYNVTLTGRVDLIHHHDNLAWADEMDLWQADPANKGKSKAGDDRTPAHRWIGALYHDGTHVAVPQDNLMRCFMEGGAMVPAGKRNKTYKSQTQSGMLVTEPFWPLTVTGLDGKGHLIPVAPILALQVEADFAQHQATAARLGFELFLKRARIGQNKHIRVRPRFAQWSLSGSILVWDETITQAVLQNVLTYGGMYRGLCDWRPGGRTPGPYGTFTATIHS